MLRRVGRSLTGPTSSAAAGATPECRRRPRAPRPSPVRALSCRRRGPPPPRSSLPTVPAVSPPCTPLSVSPSPSRRPHCLRRAPLSTSRFGDGRGRVGRRCPSVPVVSVTYLRFCVNRYLSFVGTQASPLPGVGVAYQCAFDTTAFYVTLSSECNAKNDTT